MCSNNQSGNPSSVRTSSEHLPTKFYKELCDAAHPYTANLASEVGCTLANITAQCELMQDITSELNARELVQIRAGSIVGFSETIMRQVAAVQVMHEVLLSQRNQLEKSHQQTLQDLGGSRKLVAKYQQEIKSLRQANEQASEVEA